MSCAIMGSTSDYICWPWTAKRLTNADHTGLAPHQGVLGKRRKPVQPMIGITCDLDLGTGRDSRAPGRPTHLYSTTTMCRLWPLLVACLYSCRPRRRAKVTRTCRTFCTG